MCGGGGGFKKANATVACKPPPSRAAFLNSKRNKQHPKPLVLYLEVNSDPMDTIREGLLLGAAAIGQRVQQVQ